MKNSRRAASEARKEERTSNVVPVSPVYKMVFDICEDIIRLPNSETKRALMAKMGELIETMGDNRSASAKQIEAYWRGMRREHAIKRENWLTRTISMDDRANAQPSKSERDLAQGRTIENNTSLYGSEGYMKYVLKGDGSHRSLIMRIINLMPKCVTAVHSDEKGCITIESSDSNVLLQLKMAVPSLRIFRVHEPLHTGKTVAQAGQYQAKLNGTLPQSGVGVWDEETCMLVGEMEGQRGRNHQSHYRNPSALFETEKASQILERMFQVFEEARASLRESGNLCQAHRPLQDRF